MASVSPSGTGVLKAFPQGDTGFQGLTVNFNPGNADINNAGTVKTTYGSGPEIGVGARFAGTHVTIQVLGYYYNVDASLNKVNFSGYDYQDCTISTTGYYFCYPGEQFPNTTELAISNQNKVLVMATMTVHRSGTTNDIRGTVTPCYATTAGTIVERGNQEGGYQGETDFDMESAGSGDRKSLQTSYLFQSVPNGTYRFGICASKSSSLGLSPNNYVIGAPKVVVIRLRDD